MYDGSKLSHINKSSRAAIPSSPSNMAQNRQQYQRLNQSGLNHVGAANQAANRNRPMSYKRNNVVKQQERAVKTNMTDRYSRQLKIVM